LDLIQARQTDKWEVNAEAKDAERSREAFRPEEEEPVEEVDAAEEGPEEWVRAAGNKVERTCRSAYGLTSSLPTK
jgi:hypothetical protein